MQYRRRKKDIPCKSGEFSLVAVSEESGCELWGENDVGPRTCLCFGFFEQTTYTLPFLLTTLHPSHMTLTEARTFMPLASAGIELRVGDTWW